MPADSIGLADLPSAEAADGADFEQAERGLIARLDPGVIRAADGRVIWDIDSFGGALQGSRPDSVNPSLWRQSRLTAIQGLFEVCPGIYQVRGADLSNMTLVESSNGVIVIDPLISEECASAALGLYRRHRGDRVVTAVIYTHSHLDHFGGVLGVVAADTPVPIIAPQDFMRYAVSENVYAGVAMLRRGAYYSGVPLPVGPAGKVGMGLGAAASTGTVGLLPPTLDITGTGQREVIDGVPIVFQLTPHTEAPAEMNFHFPEHRALCLAENATRNLHNILTLRGAEVRDTRMWSRYLAEAAELFLDDTDVAFASHHWPTWGRDDIATYLRQQRDLYAYLHDQTVRLMNQGYTGAEIAELVEVPRQLDAAWHTHGYYGSVSHNVKAIYQRYLGWYDGNPAHLWQHPPEAAAERWARCLGGPEQLTAKAREFLDEGDLRFAAELASHAVFAAPGSDEARTVLAEAFERLGLGAECATWRNCYLTGAMELREGVLPTPISSAGMARAMSTTQLFDSVAVRIDGPRAADAARSIRWEISDTGERYRMELSNGVLVHWPTTHEADADLTITLTRAQLPGLLLSGTADGIEMSGDRSVLATLVGLTDQPDPSFPVVTP